MPLISLLISPYPLPVENPSNIAKYSITSLVILCSFSHSSYSENTSILLLISLSISLSTSHIKSHILESNTSYHYYLFSSSNIIPLPSYISLIHLTNYFSHKLSIHIPHIYYKPIFHRISIFITHTYYKYAFHKTSISFTISILHKRYQTLILKTLLMEDINF